MLSVASVRSAGGAANYFAKDDYYVGEHASEVSGWGGNGADELGLSGEVEKKAFEDLLKGRLPDGEQVGDPERRRAGIDLTFSMPKSASVLAYVAGDERLLAAHMQAVRQTMGWVEKTFAEGRTYVDNPKGDPIRTGHLTYALFQHDTSRKLDPQAHIHVVIANLTKVAGNWQALFNDELWKNNSLIGSVYHASLRAIVEDLGYQTRQTGKHGQFEIEGVPKDVLTAFSQRRKDILAKASDLGRDGRNPELMREITKRTRDDKINLDDRDGLRAEWGERAAALGFDGKAVVAGAEARVGLAAHRPFGAGAVRHVMEAAAGWAEALREWLKPGDPLLTRGLARLGLSSAEIGAEMAVASAIRILGQREAAFPIHEVSRTALNLGLSGVTIEHVEARVQALAHKGLLIFGSVGRPDGTTTHVTTPEHIAQERRLLEGLDAGRGNAPMVLPADQAVVRLQHQAGSRPLNEEQLGAGIMALSGNDRVVVIQGVAGAGKTTLVSTLAEVARDEGRRVLGLAQANTMVEMLKGEAGIEAQTVSSFVNQHLRAALAGQGAAFDASRAMLQGTMLVLDEASLVANKPMNDLVTIANRLGGDRLVMIGDRAQLQPIDAGKAFTLIQQHRPALAELQTSQRQRTEVMKAVAALTRSGHFASAFKVMGDRVVSAGTDFREAAARKWLELSAEDRERTALYASGRESRAVLNALVQEGLKAEGALSGEGQAITRLESLHLTREELRFAQNYRAGQVLEVIGKHRPAGLDAGTYDVIRVSTKGVVSLRDSEGGTIKFRPDRLDPGDKHDSLALSQRENLVLYEGDRIRWTANDKQRGLLNSAEARVVAIIREGVEVRTGEGVNMLLPHGDRMLSRLGLAYAINMHQAQGMTADNGIGVMHSAERHLSNQRLTHVMATRVRDELTIFTDDRGALLRAVESNAGDKASALEHVGKAPSAASPSSHGRDDGAPASAGDGERNVTFAIDPSTIRSRPEPQASPVPQPGQPTIGPEKSMELGL